MRTSIVILLPLPNCLPGAILKIQPLLTLRSRLVRDRSGYEVTRNEQLKFLRDNDMTALFDAYDQVIEAIKVEIKKLELAIKEILNSDEELKQTLELITSIKGVGFIVGSYMIVYTHNFTRFENWRKFACYAGIAPFENQSGTIRSRTKVSPLANKQMKTMLHMAALKAAHADKELSTYYQKRVEDGKSKLETLNIIRNKVVARMFAIAKGGLPMWI